jgi:Zn-dependent peptidase ImmA (M78 family)
MEVTVQPALWDWACQRSGRDPSAYAKKFPHLVAWRAGRERPTLKELETFAAATRTPVGFFFLAAPPDEPLPVEDFRTIAGKAMGRPSLDLLETIYACQQKQEWYREFARTEGEGARTFVGSAKLGDDAVSVATKMRGTLGLDRPPGARTGSADEALAGLAAAAEDVGVLVMRNGIVGNNTHRRLEPTEFRGFALVDAIAPIVFVNGSDTKAAQLFTLGHELAHIWLGATGVSDAEARTDPKNAVERWCNAVAAELLVPLDDLDAEYDRASDPNAEAQRLARRFRVSTLVALRRMRDAGGLTRPAFAAAYENELDRLGSLASRGESGGDFYRMTAVRVSKRFARAMILSTWEGRSSFTEAFRLLGVRKADTVRALGASLGMTV